MSAIPLLPALGLYLAILAVLVLTALLGGIVMGAVSRVLFRPMPTRTTSEERHERRLRLIGGMDKLRGGMDRKDYL